MNRVEVYQRHNDVPFHVIDGDYRNVPHEREGASKIDADPQCRFKTGADRNRNRIYFRFRVFLEKNNNLFIQFWFSRKDTLKLTCIGRYIALFVSLYSDFLKYSFQ